MLKPKSSRNTYLRRDTGRRLGRASLEEPQSPAAEPLCSHLQILPDDDIDRRRRLSFDNSKQRQRCCTRPFSCQILTTEDAAISATYAASSLHSKRRIFARRIHHWACNTAGCPKDAACRAKGVAYTLSFFDYNSGPPIERSS